LDREPAGIEVEVSPSQPEDLAAPHARLRREMNGGVQAV